MAAVVNLARADVRHATAPEDWDVDPWALNTPAGIVDLRTGEMRAHDRQALCSKITAVAPADADCPRWRRFLDEVTGGDAELQAFLARVAGYGLTGSTREHALFFLYGTGANGKGTFLNTLTGILGDYAQIAGMDTFTESHTDRHPTELAVLRGARVVAAQETDEGRRWAESRIKALTGGDPITARFMRQDFFTYTPQFKLLIAGNHKPGLRNIDEAIRRRFHLLPFTVRIPPEQRDLQLFETLRQEWPAILGWAVHGCLEWQAAGLKPPAAVIEATAEYFDDEDSFGQWLDEACVRDPMAHETTRDLYAAWSAWAQRCGMSAGTEPKFRSALKARGFDRQAPAGPEHQRLRRHPAAAQGLHRRPAIRRMSMADRRCSASSAAMEVRGGLPGYRRHARTHAYTLDKRDASLHLHDILHQLSSFSSRRSRCNGTHEPAKDADERRSHRSRRHRQTAADAALPVRQRHGELLVPVYEADPDGRPVVHHRVVDTIGRMLRNDSISREMHDAGRDFAATFTIAQFDAMTCMSFDRHARIAQCRRSDRCPARRPTACRRRDRRARRPRQPGRRLRLARRRPAVLDPRVGDAPGLGRQADRREAGARHPGRGARRAGASLRLASSETGRSTIEAPWIAEVGP